MAWLFWSDAVFLVGIGAVLVVLVIANVERTRRR